MVVDLEALRSGLKEAEAETFKKSAEIERLRSELALVGKRLAAAEIEALKRPSSQDVARVLLATAAARKGS